LIQFLLYVFSNQFLVRVHSIVLNFSLSISSSSNQNSLRVNS